LLNSTLLELAGALEAKKVSSVELTRQFLARIDRLNGELNAFITVDDGRALEAANKADALRAKGAAGPLTGIPVAFKDIYCTKGQRTTCGSRMLENFVSPYDAHVVEQFDRAGAVPLGKCNMDEFAMGSSNESSHFGPVRNPWDRKRVPGGSSGGSATAVAARMAPGALGTDTGGSTRQPAAFSGVCGLRPTYGLVSRYGLVAFASSLDQAGPIARTAADLAALLEVMAGFDERDSTSVKREKENYFLPIELKGLRIGLPREYFAEGLEPQVRAAVEAAVAWFKSQGAKAVELELPHTRVGIAAYYVIAPAEASSNLSRFDGVRYGHRAKQYNDLVDMYCRTRAEGFGAEVKRRILVGTYVLSHGYYDAYYLHAQKIRRLIAQDFAAAFKKCDLILGPTTPTTAYPIGEMSGAHADPVQMYLGDIFTIPAPLAGLPALSIPCGFDGKGLPVGLQLTGPHFSEAKLLGAAARYQQATDWHQRVPKETPL